VRRIRAAQHEMPALSLADFKALVREQFLMLLIDPEGALSAIPPMLPPEAEARVKAFDLLRSVLTVSRGEFSPEETERSARIAGLFGVARGPATSPRLTVLPGGEKDMQAKAS
jgi:hypothetical protein